MGATSSNNPYEAQNDPMYNSSKSDYYNQNSDLNQSLYQSQVYHDQYSQPPDNYPYDQNSQFGVNETSTDSYSSSSSSAYSEFSHKSEGSEMCFSPGYSTGQGGSTVGVKPLKIPKNKRISLSTLSEAEVYLRIRLQNNEACVRYRKKRASKKQNLFDEEKELRKKKEELSAFLQEKISEKIKLVRALNLLMQYKNRSS